MAPPGEPASLLLPLSPSQHFHGCFRPGELHLGRRGPSPRRAAPGAWRGPVTRRQRRGPPLRPAPQGGCGSCRLLSILRGGVFAAARAGRLSPVFIFPEADWNAAWIRWRSCAWGALRPGPARRPRSLPQLVVIILREPSSGRPRRGRPRFDGDGAVFKWCPRSLVDGYTLHLSF